MTLIPAFQNRSSRYKMQMELGGSVFELSFSWNARESFWYMGISLQDSTGIVSNIKVTPSYLLIQQFRATANIPDGDFLLIDLERDPATSDVTFENLGVRYILAYITREELDERGIR